MSMIPLLLRPRWQGLRNRWRANFDARTEAGRDVVILIFSLVVMAAVLRGTLGCLDYVKNNPNLAALPAHQPLGLIFLVLFGMLVISSLASALGAFYLSEDLDLILASPISSFRFFLGRFAYVAVVSAWMPTIFIAPLLLGFGLSYGAEPKFYIVGVVVLLPYFLIPATIAVVVATVLSVLIPASRTRVARVLLAGIFILILFGFFDLLHRGVASVNNAHEIVRMIQMLSMPSTVWLPSYWVANCFQQLLRPTSTGALPDLIMLYSVAAGIGSLGFILVDIFHYRAYSNARNNRLITSVRRRFLDRFFHKVLFFVAQPIRGLFLKEWKMVSREVTHLLELSMLMGLCILYLYNLRLFAVIDSVASDSRGWWQNLLFVLNVGMDAFVATALCTRFVYPSISREGRGYWLLYTSPLSVADVMRAKFLCWLIPVGLVSSAFFAAGAYSLGISNVMILITSISSWIICYGIVGSGVGFGAMFAVFDWEHPSQLAAGFGSFVYMLFCTILIFLNMIPIWVLLFVPLHKYFGVDPSLASTTLIYLGFAGCLFALNHYASAWAMEAGRRRLSDALK